MKYIYEECEKCKYFTVCKTKGIEFLNQYTLKNFGVNMLIATEQKEDCYLKKRFDKKYIDAYKIERRK